MDDSIAFVNWVTDVITQRIFLFFPLAGHVTSSTWIVERRNQIEFVYDCKTTDTSFFPSRSSSSSDRHQRDRKKQVLGNRRRPVLVVKITPILRCPDYHVVDNRNNKVNQLLLFLFPFLPPSCVTVLRFTLKITFSLLLLRLPIP